MTIMNFFSDHDPALGPTVSDEIVAAAERTLGFRLPGEYVELLRYKNGGVPRRRCFRTSKPTSWANDHFEIRRMLGIGYSDGLDGQFGSKFLIEEWGYPPIGIVVFELPSGGHDTVMLDYSKCGPLGAPRVCYIDEDRLPRVVSPCFRQFIEHLEDCQAFD
jgi:hypothetical protein